MKDCGQPDIDTQKEALINRAKFLLDKYKSNQNSEEMIDEVKLILKDLLFFRKGLAWNRATEFIEGDCGWTETFNIFESELKKMTN